MSRRVLILNILAGRTGSETFARDLALGLHRAGWDALVYTPELGPLALELQAAGVPVVDRLSAISPAPDLIHGSDIQRTLAALALFPETPAVTVVHNRVHWADRPPRHPRILRFLAVDHCCQEVLDEAGIPADQQGVVYNSVDLDRFRPRPPLPAKPRRALLFSNYAGVIQSVGAIRKACRRQGIQLDVVGSGVGQTTDQPERLLVDYDIVFGKARCAMEAMAVGCATILCDLNGFGGLVTPDRYDHLRRYNFGRMVLDQPVEAARIEASLQAYDVASVEAVSRRMRSEGSLEAMVQAWTEVYAEAIQRWQTGPGPDPRAEGLFLSDVLETWVPPCHPIYLSGLSLERRLKWGWQKARRFVHHLDHLPGIQGWFMNLMTRAQQSYRTPPSDGREPGTKA